MGSFRSMLWDAAARAMVSVRSTTLLRKASDRKIFGVLHVKPIIDKYSCYAALQAAKEFVEFVGGIEVGFEFARGELFAKIVEPTREEVERRGENFLIGEDDIAPGVIGTAGEAQRIAQAGTSQCNGQAVFVEAVVEESSERDGRELW